VLFILLYDCVGLVSGFIALEQACMGIKVQQSDLDSKWTKGLQLHANEQIHASRINDVEATWTEANLIGTTPWTSTARS
jgi:hypothetical protein